MHHEIDILTIGDSAIDEFLLIQDGSASEEDIKGQREICFIHGSKIPVKSFDTTIAGNAVNVGAGCNKAGLRVAVYTEIGDDQNADRIVRELDEMGINTKYCIKNPGTPTDVHPIVVYANERTIFVYHERRFYKVRDWPTPKWIYYSSIGEGFEEFQQELVDYLNNNPSIGVAFNPGTYQLKSGLEGLRNFLEVTDVLIVNKEEAEIIAGKAGSLEESHLNLQKLGPKLTLITDGKNGSSAYDGKELIIVPVFEEDKPIADKTGAGDSYSSGFLSALFHNKPLKEALMWGSVNSSGVIREVGAIRGLRTKEELENLVQAEVLKI
jgi:sugar/nucleoside kinase (ribokinase family)